MYDAILFDLDGTLLPMELEEFIHGYFLLLLQKLQPFGYAPEKLKRAVWEGIGAMVRNDGAMPNRERFWDCFAAILGDEVRAQEPLLLSFYENEFWQAVRYTQPVPKQAQLAVEKARMRAKKVILATNPLFPRVGVATRLRWLGLRMEDFDFVTTYETASYCKPNPAYFRELLTQQGLSAQRCLMIGNDADEDMTAAGQAGIRCFLVTDCLRNPNSRPLTAPHGSFEEMLAFL